MRIDQYACEARSARTWPSGIRWLVQEEGGGALKREVRCERWTLPAAGPICLEIEGPLERRCVCRDTKFADAGGRWRHSRMCVRGRCGHTGHRHRAYRLYQMELATSYIYIYYVYIK